MVPVCLHLDRNTHHFGNLVVADLDPLDLARDWEQEATAIGDESPGGKHSRGGGGGSSRLRVSVMGYRGVSSLMRERLRGGVDMAERAGRISPGETESLQ